MLLVFRLELLALVVEVPWACQGGLRLVLEERVVQHLTSRRPAARRRSPSIGHNGDGECAGSDRREVPSRFRRAAGVLVPCLQKGRRRADQLNRTKRRTELSIQTAAYTYRPTSLSLQHFASCERTHLVVDVDFPHLGGHSLPLLLLRLEGTTTDRKEKNTRERWAR